MKFKFSQIFVLFSILLLSQIAMAQHQAGDYRYAVQDKVTEKWAYIDITGKQVSDFIYDDAYAVDKNGIAVVQIDKKWGKIDKKGNPILPFGLGTWINGSILITHKEEKRGAIDRAGKTVIPFKYVFLTLEANKTIIKGMYSREASDGVDLYDAKTGELLGEFSDLKNKFRHYIATQKGKKGLFDDSYKPIIPIIYDSLFLYNKRFITAKKDGKWGLMDYTGKVLQDFKYDNHLATSALNYTEIELFVLQWNKKKSIINSLGQFVLPSEYDDVYNPSGKGFFALKKAGKWALFSPKAEQLTPFKYDSGYFKELCKNEHTPFLNKRANKTVIISPQGEEIGVYDVVHDYEILFAINEGKSILLNEQGKAISKYYDKIKNTYGYPYQCIEEGDKVGIIHTADGRVLCEPKYKSIYTGVVNGQYFFSVENEQRQHALFNQEWKQLSPFNQQQFIFNAAAIQVKYQGKISLLKESGEIMMPFKYTNLNFVKKGRTVQNGFYYGYNKKSEYYLIDSTGRHIDTEPYTKIKNRDDVCSFIYRGDKVGVILHTGEIIVPAIYKDVKYQSRPACFIVTNAQNKMGLMDMEGNIILPFEYDDLDDYYDIFYTKKDGKTGVFDAKKHTTRLPPNFAFIRKIDQSNCYKVSNDSLHWGIAKNDTLLFAPKYRFVRHNYGEFGFNYFSVSNDNEKWGLANKNGKLVVPMEYARVSPFFEGVATVETFDREVFFINKRLKRMFDFPLYRGSFFENNKAEVTFHTQANYTLFKNGDLKHHAYNKKYETPLYLTYKNGDFYIKNKNGQLNKTAYETAPNFFYTKEGLKFIKIYAPNKRGRSYELGTGILNAQNEEVSSIIYKRIRSLSYRCYRENMNSFAPDPYCE